MRELLSIMDNVLSKKKTWKRLYIFIITITIISFLLLVGNVKAYNIEGNGICNCSHCNDCNNALNDDDDCYNEVKLTNNITHQGVDCISFDLDSKIFNGQGHSISNSGTAITISNNFNFTIKNILLNNNINGIYATDTQKLHIFNTYVSKSIYTGIEVEGDIWNMNISNNIITYNRFGLTMLGMHETIMTDNVICKNTEEDITLEGDENTFTLKQNNRCDTSTNFECDLLCHANCSTCDNCNEKIQEEGLYDVFLNDDIITDNPTCIIINKTKNFDCRNNEISGNVGTAITINVSDIIVSNCSFVSVNKAINAFNASNILLKNLIFSDSLWGVIFRNINNSKIEECNFLCNNDDIGINLHESNNNIIKYSNLTNCLTAIYIHNNSNINTVERNNINNSVDYGIYLVDGVNDSKIYNNSIYNSYIGMYMYAENSFIWDTDIKHNEMKYNSYGLAGYSNLFGQMKTYINENRICKNSIKDLSHYKGLYYAQKNHCDGDYHLCKYPCNLFMCSNCSDCNFHINNNSEAERVMLTNNLTIVGDCINVSKKNKSFECNNNKIDGDGQSTAIFVSNDNISVLCCEILNFYNGIEMTNVKDLNIINNTLHHIRRYPLLFHSSNATIINNTFHTNSWSKGYKTFGVCNLSWDNNIIRINNYCVDDTNCIATLLFAIIAGGGLTVYYYRKTTQ